MSKKEICILSVLAALIVAAVIAAFSIRGNREPERVAGEFTPPPFAENASGGAPSPDEVAGLHYGEFALSDQISLSMVSTLTVDENGDVEIWMTAPATNDGWVMVRLMDQQGRVLAESGLLKANQFIRTLHLDIVPQSSGIVLAKILTYEPGTYYSMGSATAQVMLNVP
jgi:hypothetical protein